MFAKLLGSESADDALHGPAIVTNNNLLLLVLTATSDGLDNDEWLKTYGVCRLQSCGILASIDITANFESGIQLKEISVASAGLSSLSSLAYLSPS